jgi:hypothetical protein
MDRDEMSNLYKAPSIDVSYQQKNVSSLWLRWKNGLIFEINIFCINEKQFEPSTVLIPTF